MGQNDPYTGTLRIDKKGDGGTYRIFLNDQRIENLLAADGLKIEWESIPELPMSEPVVTLTFGFGALDVDLDVDLVESILAAKAEKGVE